jgi:hypothetical protein
MRFDRVHFGLMPGFDDRFSGAREVERTCGVFNLHPIALASINGMNKPNDLMFFSSTG